EIDKLQEERIEIAKQIRQVNLAINNLKTNQEYYQDLLGRAEKLKKDLEQRIAELSADEKSIFNQIKSVEERRAEIQNEIAEVKKKQEEIQIQKDLYQALKLKYRDMHNRLITYEKENEASVGNIVRWGFKAFDKVTDLIPGKYGLKIIGKTATVTRKFAQGMAKTTLTLHEGHRLWHMYNEVANENKEHPPMITKETLEIYTKNIDDDLAKLDADYKDYEKILGDYKLKLDKDNLTKEVLNSEKQNQTVRKEIKSWVDEYSATSEELNLKLNEVLDTKDLNMKLDGLEEKLSIKTEELNVTKEELKQKNPIYARAQQRLQAQRGGKVPEMVMIPNK
ncbi:MAG: DNA double-strand break repair protein Rad50, partial [Candidatus Phytoplasma sp. TWB_XP]